MAVKFDREKRLYLSGTNLSGTKKLDSDSGLVAVEIMLSVREKSHRCGRRDEVPALIILISLFNL
jgi:hypothetical protein